MARNLAIATCAHNRAWQNFDQFFFDVLHCHSKQTKELTAKSQRLAVDDVFTSDNLRGLFFINSLYASLSAI